MALALALALSEYNVCFELYSSSDESMVVNAGARNRRVWSVSVESGMKVDVVCHGRTFYELIVVSGLDWTGLLCIWMYGGIVVL